jgi:signal peptidase I
MTRIFRTIGAVAIALLFCIVVVVGVAGAYFHIRAVSVLTGSMRPNYPPGSLVLTRPVATDSLHVGQVIAFRPPAPFTTPHNAPIMHRIVRIDHKDGAVVIKTRGDANPAPDPWQLELHQKQTFTAVWSAPNVGRIATAARNVNGEVSAITILGLFLMTSALLLWPRRKLIFQAPVWRFDVPLYELMSDAPLVNSAPHELRSALSHVRAAVELALQDATEEQRTLLQIAERGTDQLTTAIENLLFAVGLERWHSSSDVGIEKLVMSAAQRTHVTPEQVVLTDSSVEQVVCGNPDALSRAVEGMVEHVRFATHTAQPTIVLSTDNDRICVKVNGTHTETGRFNAEHWLETSSLNLALAQRVAIDHGGSIVLDDDSQQMSLALSLPAADARL